MKRKGWGGKEREFGAILYADAERWLQRQGLGTFKKTGNTGSKAKANRRAIKGVRGKAAPLPERNPPGRGGSTVKSKSPSQTSKKRFSDERSVHIIKKS